MLQLYQKWIIGPVDFHLVEGDLFEVPVSAIVNSEQTDFHLAGNPNTISGQIRRRYGVAVQNELDQQTQRMILPVGTVLSTQTGSDYSRIYHVGFHEPGVYPETDDEQTEYLPIMRRSVRKVLELAVEDGLTSVGFPLLGTGLFGLDPTLLAYEFMAEVGQFAATSSLPDRFEVWLVVRDEAIIHLALDGIVQALIDRAAPRRSWEPLNLGVSYLDLYEQHCARSDHPTWSAWQLCRYCELLTGFMLYNLAAWSIPSVSPSEVVDRRQSITFGTLRTKAVDLAHSWSGSKLGDTWASFFAAMLTEDDKGPRRLTQIKNDRNNIAHGRQVRPAVAIWADLCGFLQLQRWQSLREQLGPPALAQLSPWLHVVKSGPEASEAVVAILDLWDNDTWHYLVPHTGQLKVVKPNLAG